MDAEVMTRAEYRRWRFYAESLIEQAISILDAIDGDPDLEDSGDGEPSLTSPVGGHSQLCWSAGCDDDREQDRQAA
jgi:hypothetical protein